MSPTKAVLAFIGLCIAVAVATVLWTHFNRPIPAGPMPGEDVAQPKAVTMLSLTHLIDDLASQISGSVGASDTYRVIPIKQGAWPIGTLVRVNAPGHPVNYEACAPITPVQSHQAPNMFPTSYEVDTGTAADIGLSPDLRGKVNAEVALKESNAVKLNFDRVEMAVLADDDITALTMKPACRAALKGRSLLMIRGLIKGKRVFTLQRSAASTGKVEAQLASFDINAGSGTSLLTVSDHDPLPFLAVVSTVSGSDTPGVSADVKAPTLGLIYLQRDVRDQSDAGRKLAGRLAQTDLHVVKTIETIPSAKMPSKASVRYFNDSDSEDARRVLMIVQQEFPDATLKQLQLFAPPGQMEVWLPRAK